MIKNLPHEAVAEVSKDKEPIRRGCVEFKWFESQLMSEFKWIESQMIWLWIGDLRFKCFGCQLIWLVANWCVIQMILVVNWFKIQLIWYDQMIWDSHDFARQLIRGSSDWDVKWFEIQVIWLSTDVWFKWFWLSVDLRSKWIGCELIWVSSDLVVKWFEIQRSWLWIDLRFKWFGCQMVWHSTDLIVKRFGIQVIWLSTGLGFKRVGVFLFCETSFKNEALKLKSEAFGRDVLQKWSFEDWKHNVFARLPSIMTCWPDTWPQNSNTFWNVFSDF